LKELKCLIYEKYVVKKILNADTVVNLDKNVVISKFKNARNSEISWLDDGGIYIYGYKEDVHDINEKIKDMIIESNNDIHENLDKIKSIKLIDKNIEWQYKELNEWTPLNSFLNNVAENAYSTQRVERHTCPIGFGKNIIFDFSYFILLMSENFYALRRFIVDDTPKKTKDQEDFLELPSHWDPFPDNTGFSMTELLPTSDEHKRVSNNFKSSSGQLVQKIERIQNERLYKQYVIHKEYLKRRLGNENEKTAFHGTSSESTKSICKFGFNRSYCGKNGVALGCGVYFALESSTSVGYCRSNSSSGYKQMFQCRIVVGEATGGNSSMTTAPIKPNGEPYDSTTNGTNVFVCYNDNQCYPEYLIHFQ